MPAWASACIISSRPDFASWSGKNPRFPTMTPIVIFLPELLSDIRILSDRTKLIKALLVPAIAHVRARAKNAG